MSDLAGDNILFYNFSKKDWWFRGGYRLGDMVAYQTGRDAQWIGKEYHCSQFPESIAAEYMQLTDESNNLKVLDDIINRRLTTSEEGSTVAIIHLRLGDVINWAPFTAQEFLVERRCHHENWAAKDKQSYVRPLSYYETLPFPKGINSILIYGSTRCGGSRQHDAKDIEDSKSIEYVRAVVQKLSERGYAVRAHLNGDPDKDFLAMAGSRYFVPSGGGYSLLIAKMVLKRNNKVYLESQKGFIKADAVASMVGLLSEILRN